VLITFEGIDGCGKTTQIELLEKWFRDENYSYSIFREPGGTILSERIRELLLDSKQVMDPVTELLLFSAARSQLISEKVLPRLNRGETVILDRFYDSTTAYQGYGRKSVSLAQIEALNQLAGHSLVPDLTFYLQITVNEAEKRTASLQKDRMEQSGNKFFEEVVRGFDEIANRELRFITIDAIQAPEIIHQQVIRAIRNFRTEGYPGKKS